MMKTWFLCLFLTFFVARSAIDYSTQQVFDTTTCTSPQAGYHKSPIIIDNSICGPYGTFSLSMTDVTTAGTFSATTGAYTLAYTGASLTYNSTTYTSTSLLIRYKSENILFAETNQADAEIQIIMQDRDGRYGVLAFLIRAVGTNAGYRQAYNGYKIINTLTPTSWNFKLSTLAQSINNKPSQEQFLNIFRYQGTLTYLVNSECPLAIWYVYGSELFVDDLTAFINGLQTAATAASVVLRNNQNTRAAVTTTALKYGGSGGPIPVERLCFSGYFENHMGDNYGLWFGVVSILIFFIFTLTISDTPIKDPEYQESCKTIHPLYSIYKVGNEMHTKKSRTSLILMSLTMHALFSSVWYRDAYPNIKSSDIIVFAVYSMIISWFYTYMLGNILRGYYTAKYHYCKTRDEAWDQKAQNRIFAYYVAVFATICIAWPFCVWNMSEIHPEVDVKASNYWVASFFVGLGLEFLVIDTIFALLARSSNFLKNLLRRKGYMYDNMCHETYMNFLKMD